jgi:hypothetical protein
MDMTTQVARYGRRSSPTTALTNSTVKLQQISGDAISADGSLEFIVLEKTAHYAKIGIRATGDFVGALRLGVAKEPDASRVHAYYHSQGGMITLVVTLREGDQFLIGDRLCVAVDLRDPPTPHCVGRVQGRLPSA